MKKRSKSKKKVTRRKRSKSKKKVTRRKRSKSNSRKYAVNIFIKEEYLRQRVAI